MWVTDPPLLSPSKISLQSLVCTENCVASAAETLRLFHVRFVSLCNVINPVMVVFLFQRQLVLCSNFTRTPASGLCRLPSAFGFYVIRRNDLPALGKKDAHVCPVGSSSVSVAIKISSSAVVSGFPQHPVCLRLPALVRVVIQVGRRPQKTLLGL
jgi:hypothetical protein